MIRKFKQITHYLNYLFGSTSLLDAQLRLFNLMLGANIIKGGIYWYDAVVNHAGDGSGRAVRLMVTSALMIFYYVNFQISSFGVYTMQY